MGQETNAALRRKLRTQRAAYEELLELASAIMAALCVRRGDGASITAAAQYDSDGQWHTLANVTAGAKRTFTLPVLPRRCDHFRLRLTGTGAWRLCSLTRTETAAGPQH